MLYLLSLNLDLAYILQGSNMEGMTFRNHVWLILTNTGNVLVADENTLGVSQPPILAATGR